MKVLLIALFSFAVRHNGETRGTYHNGKIRRLLLSMLMNDDNPAMHATDASARHRHVVPPELGTMLAASRGCQNKRVP